MCRETDLNHEGRADAATKGTKDTKVVRLAGLRSRPRASRERHGHAMMEPLNGVSAALSAHAWRDAPPAAPPFVAFAIFVAHVLVRFVVFPMTTRL